MAWAQDLLRARLAEFLGEDEGAAGDRGDDDTGREDESSSGEEGSAGEGAGGEGVSTPEEWSGSHRPQGASPYDGKVRSFTNARGETLQSSFSDEEAISRAAANACGNKFVQGLAASYRRSRRLSPEQWYWVHRYAVLGLRGFPKRGPKQS